MITALIAKPPPRTRTLEKPTRLDPPAPRRGLPKNHSDSSTFQVPQRTFDPPDVIDDYDEGQHITKLILMMLLVLVLPAILLLVYIVLNPESFQYDITPQQDFSSWRHGKS